jgi:adenine-specific DNA-methyltransferase
MRAMARKACKHLRIVPGPGPHHPRRHAAVRTKDFVFSQLIPYIGNKRKLLSLIAAAVEFTRIKQGDFVDLFTGSTVVARWAKTQGFRVLVNDWEPYSHQLALGTIVPNGMPHFTNLSGAAAVFNTLNSLPPIAGYFATHLCPQRDDAPDPEHDRMFFTQANGQRIDAIGQCIARWHHDQLIDETERAFLLASLIYAVSYVSNTSGVFKGFHRGFGGRTRTALYRIMSNITLQLPALYDNQQHNIATRLDAALLAPLLRQHLGREPDIVYIDPPYNQHPYGSNYHVLNTVALWDNPPVSRLITPGEKSAIRKDWRTLRRSAYNIKTQALHALQSLLDSLNSRWVLLSYSTDGNIPLPALLEALSRRGQLTLFAQSYKRYRVSTQRMSQRSHNVEFVAVLDRHAAPDGSRSLALCDALDAMTKQFNEL